MTTIYLDPSVLAMAESTERLRQLSDAGHDLVVVGVPTAPAPAAAVRAERVPDALDSPAWFLTAEPTTCRDRRPDLRTLLVGPRTDERWPTRCDATARDMREAVLDILAADAMGR